MMAWVLAWTEQAFKSFRGLFLCRLLSIWSYCLVIVQGSTKRLRPGFVNTAGKFKQKW